MLGCSRGSVLAHSSGQVAYSSAIISRLRLRRPLVVAEWLTLDEAAPWLPGHPSHKKMFGLVKSGRLVAELRRRAGPRRKSDPRGGSSCYMTRFAWMREFACSQYPPGVWVPVGDCEFYAGQSLPLVAVHNGAVPLRSLLSACEERGLVPAFGPAVIRRAVQSVEKVGVCLL